MCFETPATNEFYINYGSYSPDSSHRQIHKPGICRDAPPPHLYLYKEMGNFLLKASARCGCVEKQLEKSPLHGTPRPPKAVGIYTQTRDNGKEFPVLTAASWVCLSLLAAGMHTHTQGWGPGPPYSWIWDGSPVLGLGMDQNVHGIQRSPAKPQIRAV